MENINIYFVDTKELALDIATQNNPNVECSIIKDTLFIGDLEYGIDAYLMIHLTPVGLN
jgi:hypothetical protein